MIEQLLLHILGDYVLQPDIMAKKKVEDIMVAYVHSLVYTLPFLLITNSIDALTVMFTTHLLIDRFRLAKYLCFIKNKIFEWEDCKVTGYHKNTPDYITFWLSIIVDNFLHLTINYFSITYL